MEKNYKDSLLFRHAYIQQDSGTKCLDDLYHENFEVLAEACDKAEKYDLLVELIKSYGILNFNDLETSLKLATQGIRINNEDIYTIVRTIIELNNSLTFPSIYETNLRIEANKTEYRGFIDIN